MRPRRPRASIVLMLGAVALGVGSTAALRAHLAQLEAAAATGEDLVEVSAAARPLARGTLLTSEDLVTASLPRDYVPPGALPPGDPVGATLASDVASGEVVTKLRLASGGPLGATVPKGLRAFGLTVTTPPDVLAPGDRVDVLGTFTAGAPYVETLAEEVEVLRVVPGDALEGGRTATVFVLVAPETVERLAAAAASAHVSIAIGGAP